MSFREVTDEEVRVGVEYAQTEYSVLCLEPDLVRLFTNKTLAEREITPRIPPAFIAAKKIRDKFRARTKEEDMRVQAYKGAVMKILAERRAWQQRNKMPAKKFKPDSTVGRDRFPADRRGQYLLL